MHPLDPLQSQVRYAEPVSVLAGCKNQARHWDFCHGSAVPSWAPTLPRCSRHSLGSLPDSCCCSFHWLEDTATLHATLQGWAWSLNHWVPVPSNLPISNTKCKFFCKSREIQMIWTLSSADCRQQSCPQNLSRLPRLRVYHVWRAWEVGSSPSHHSLPRTSLLKVQVCRAPGLSTSVTHEDLSVPCVLRAFTSLIVK